MPKLGSKIITHDELRDAFNNDILMPYLRQKMGLLADIKMERRLGKGFYDARIGGLYFDFVKPGEGLTKKIEEVREKYIPELKKKEKEGDYFITDGYQAAHLDVGGEVIERGATEDLASTLIKLLEVHGTEIIEPEDLLDAFGEGSALYQAHMEMLWDLLDEYSENDIVEQAFKMWKRVYAESANLTKDAKKAVKKQAKNLDLSLRSTEEVRKFLFATQTYFSTLMKLMAGKISGLIREESVSRWLQSKVDVIEAYGDLKETIEVKGTVEHDLFDWFTNPAKISKDAHAKISDALVKLASTVDVIDYTKVETDLLREIYQQSFSREMRIAMGEFYTNEKLVDEVLDSVDYKGRKILDKRVFDPTCGSGTFLARAIKRFRETAEKENLDEVEILERITNQIIGIDLHPFAVSMAKTNYLLAISDLFKGKRVDFLKSLEIPIYWTDSLTSFEEVSFGNELLVRAMPLEEDLHFPNPQMVDLDVVIDKLEMAIGLRWSKERFLEEFDQDTLGKFKTTLSNLFQFFTKQGNTMWIPTLRNTLKVLDLRGDVNYLIGNPPWVRKRNVDAKLRNRLSESFEFYEEMWNPELEKIRFFRGSMDYSVAFVESGFDYLKEKGRLGFVITSNVVRNLYAGNFRKKLIKESSILELRDYALSNEQLFKGAQNAPLILSFEKAQPENNHKTEISIVNRSGNWKKWKINQAELPLLKNDSKSPWMLIPTKAVSAVRKMLKGNKMLGDLYRVSRGVQTAANTVFWVEKLEKTDEWPEVSFIETKGGRGVESQKVRIETDMIRPLLRGRNIDAWNFETKNYIIWTHSDETGEVKDELLENAENFFNREEVKEKLLNRRARTIKRPIEKGAPFWIIGDVNQKKLKDKVAFQGIAKEIKAVYIPSKHQDEKLGKVKTITDANVYFIPVESEELGYKFSALLNSTPIRTYYSAYAMRTGAQYCAFRSWMMGLIPIPKKVREGDEKLSNLSKKLHKNKGGNEELLEELDEKVAKLYGLTQEELSTMKDFLNFFVN